jgi:hypothetical protein
MAMPVVDPPAMPVAPVRHEVLQSVYVHRLLSTTQVHALHAPHTSRRWIQGVLAGLERDRYLDRVTTARARQALWFVTDQGAEACEGSGVPSRPYRMTSERAAGPLQAHTLAVNEVGLAFVAAARERGDDFDAWSWRHESAHPLGEREGKGEVVIADAVLDYTAHGDGTVLCRFLELDRATMPLRELEAKLTAYARLYQFRPKVGGWRAYYPQWPKVLIVFCGKPAPALERRMRSLLELVASNRNLGDVHDPESDFDIFLTLLEDLRRTGPFSPVFWRPGSPQTPVDVLGRPAPGPAPAPRPSHADAGGRGGRFSTPSERGRAPHGART